MRLALGILLACSLFGCQATPVVAPAPDIAAVRKQNQVTKQHVGKVRVSQGDADKHLDSAVKALDELLQE